MKRLLLLWVIAVPLVTQAQTPDDLFQQALRLERSQGDLEGAITLYERIASEHGDERDTASKALFNLGQAYETLGRRDAAGAYERLISDYSEYGNLVEAAKGRLLALAPDVPQVRPPSLVSGPLMERFETTLQDDRLWESSISPDGHYLIGYNYGDLPIEDLRTGEVTYAGVKEGVGDKRSPRVGGDERNTNDWASSGRFNPDMSRIAYSWTFGEMTVFSGGRKWERNSVNMIDRQTGVITELLDVTEYFGGSSDWPTILGWSPDGSEVIATISTDRWSRSKMVAIDASTRNVRELLDPAPEFMYCITGGGRYALVGSPLMEVAEAERVDLVNGGLTSWPDLLGNSSWLMGCDDQFAYTISDTYGSSALQRWPLKDGMPTGRAEVVLNTGSENFLGAGVTQGGDLFLMPSNSLGTYRAEFDPVSGMFSAPVQRILGSSLGPEDWSSATGRILNWSFGRCLRVIEIDGSVGDCVFLEDGGRGTVRWLDDGNTIIGRLGATDTLATYDIRTGARIETFGELHLLDVIDRSLVLVNDGPCIKRLNVGSKEAEDLFCDEDTVPPRRGAWFRASVSRDASRMAYTYQIGPEEARQGVMGTINFATGENVRRYTSEALGMVTWLPGDRSLLFYDHSGGEPHAKLLILTGNSVTDWFDEVEEFGWVNRLQFSPDGTEVIFGGQAPGDNDQRMGVVRNAGGAR